MTHNEYRPDEVSAPGESLADVLEERGVSQAELARRMGNTEAKVANIINGKAPITPEIAATLEFALGVPAAFWNNRQKQYQEALKNKQKAHE